MGPPPPHLMDTSVIGPTSGTLGAKLLGFLQTEYPAKFRHLLNEPYKV